MRLFIAITSLFISASITSLNANAEALDWYQVELALIAYQNQEVIDHENWPDVIPAREASEQQDAFDWLNWWNQPITLNNDSNNLFAVSNTQVTTPALQPPFISTGDAFATKLQKIDRRKDMQVIWSDKWNQPIPEKAQAESDGNPVNISLRKSFSNKQNLDIEVTGTVHLYRSRYLHLVSDLQVQHWQHLGNDTSVDKALDIPLCSQEIKDNLIPSNTATPLTTLCEVPVRAAMVEQSRRMRSRELHYIDHPLLGIMVRAIPVDQIPPQEVEQ